MLCVVCEPRQPAPGDCPLGLWCSRTRYSATARHIGPWASNKYLDLIQRHRKERGQRVSSSFLNIFLKPPHLWGQRHLDSSCAPTMNRILNHLNSTSREEKSQGRGSSRRLSCFWRPYCASSGVTPEASGGVLQKSREMNSCSSPPIPRLLSCQSQVQSAWLSYTCHQAASRPWLSPAASLWSLVLLPPYVTARLSHGQAM